MAFASLTTNPVVNPAAIHSAINTNHNNNDNNDNKNDNNNSNNNNNDNNNNNSIINEQVFKIDGELLAQGAEAKIYKSLYEAKMTIVKYRFPKKYRHPQLDLSLRKNRTKNEQRSMNKARKAGIPVPQVYYCDKINCALHMEFIDLPTVKFVLIKYYNIKTKKYNDNKCEIILKEIGKVIALLHKSNIIHGDLTTSNLLINENKKSNNNNNNVNDAKNNDDDDQDIDLINVEIIMIDFGLAQGSTKQEDKAVDLYVLERAFVSTHPESKYMINTILESYKKHYPSGSQKVLKRLDAVRLRGRKRSMLG